MYLANTFHSVVKKGSERCLFKAVRQFSTEAVEDSVIRQAGIIDDSDDSSNYEEYIEMKRNKSRLLPQHHNILHNKVPYSSSKGWFHDTIKYKRRLYGRYGSISAVHPGVMWPTKNDLDDIREYESVAYPHTLEEMIEKSIAEKKLRESTIREREEAISKKMESLEKWKEELKARVLKKEEAMLAAKARKDRLMEEVRRHFGFKVDPRDDRFKEMLEKKEREEKKLAKEAKRKAKEAKAMAKLTEAVAKASIESKD
ncbi:growth arrest and DNA damage-inducible proteins-interacting protein 1 [Schistocerca cancellata]|uniref:growth arrest and DNA damage-inducible proteins-interacting protein 1 n=1 Tax=Schistocerca cancellata TaxID=274614 RepID=UPI002117F346|nr:growth arrest and DNA damage-inducible proteins-interacting protein 1 [Schistocerca cancellata]